MAADRMNGPRHPIEVVSRRTGLSADVLRVWERRYQAVSPGRTGGSRRLYTDEDVERLILLRRATLSGRRIGQIARLGREELERLVREDEAAASSAPRLRDGARRDAVAAEYLEAGLDALGRMDAARLEGVLTRATVDLSVPVLLEQVLSPMLRRIGEDWREGSLRPAHEHLASAMIRSVLGALRLAPAAPGGPALLVTTPAGHLHEIGALMAAVAAASEGWRVVYLGPNLPAEEIAAAAATIRPKGVALSLVYPTDDAGLTDEFRRLRRHLGPGVALVVGGSGAEAYREVLDEIGAVRATGFISFRRELESIRLRQG